MDKLKKRYPSRDWNDMSAKSLKDFIGSAAGLCIGSNGQAAMDSLGVVGDTNQSKNRAPSVDALMDQPSDRQLTVPPSEFIV